MSDFVCQNMISRTKDFQIGASTTPPTLQLILYVNNVEVACGTIESDLTLCTAPGYAAVSLSYSSWSGSVDGSTCVADYTYPTITFIFTGPGSPGQTIYGYAVFETGAAKPWWGHSLAAPYTIPSGGGALVVALELISQPCVAEAIVAEAPRRDRSRRPKGRPPAVPPAPVAELGANG